MRASQYQHGARQGEASRKVPGAAHPQSRIARKWLWNSMLHICEAPGSEWCPLSSVATASGLRTATCADFRLPSQAVPSQSAADCTIGAIAEIRSQCTGLVYDSDSYAIWACVLRS